MAHVPSPVAATPIAQYVARARRGDREAFDLLAATVVDRLYAIARLILRDADRAEDAVQEALVRCWRDLPALREPDRFEPWVRKILVRAINDEFRTAERQRGAITMLRLEPEAYPEELRPLIPVAVDVARLHPDEYIRHRVEVQLGSGGPFMAIPDAGARQAEPGAAADRGRR